MRVSNYDLQMQAAGRSFLACSTEEIAARFGLQRDAQWLYVSFLSAPHRISLTEGRVEEKRNGQWNPASFHTSMTIYDLLANPNGRPVLSGTWCAHDALNAVRSGTLRGKLVGVPPEAARLFSGKQDRLAHACKFLGGTPVSGGDYACILPIFDFFPVLLRFWDADEEFPAQLQLLWDQNTPRYLHFETTFYTIQAIIERLKSLL